MDILSLLCILLLQAWILLWTNRLLLSYFSEGLRGWLDYPGPSVLFSSPLRGVSWDFSRGHPSGIYFQVLFVASLEFSDGSVRFSCRHPTGISFQDQPWCHLTPNRHFFSRPTVVSLDAQPAFLFKTSRGVAWVDGRFVSLNTLLDPRLAFLFKTYRGVTWCPTGIYFYFLGLLLMVKFFCAS